jgi:hypothetical protein
MSCERFTGALTDHAAGGELPAAVRTHLGGCARCREVLADARREMSDLDRDLEAMLASEPSVEFAARVRQRIDAEGDRRSTFGIWRWAFGVAAAAVVAVVVVMAIRGRGVALVPSEAPPPSQAVRVPTPPVPIRVPTPAVAPVKPEQRLAAAGRSPRVNTTAGPQPLVRAEPEVLVPPDQRAAVARLIDLTRRGRVAPALFEERAPSPVVSVAEVPPLVVTEMDVPVLVPPGGSPPGGGAGRGFERN